RRDTSSTDPALLDVGPEPRNGHAWTPAPANERAPLDPGEADTGAFDDHVVAGLRELGEVPRACLLLRTLRELSYAEIAELLEIPEGTAMSHVHRARLALRARLDPTLDGVRP